MATNLRTLLCTPNTEDERREASQMWEGLLLERRKQAHRTGFQAQRSSSFRDLLFLDEISSCETDVLAGISR